MLFLEVPITRSRLFSKLSNFGCFSELISLPTEWDLGFCSNSGKGHSLQALAILDYELIVDKRTAPDEQMGRRREDLSS